MAMNLISWKVCGTIAVGLTSTAALTFVLGGETKSDLEISAGNEESQRKTTETETNSMLPPSIHKKDKCLFLAT